MGIFSDELQFLSPSQLIKLPDISNHKEVKFRVLTEDRKVSLSKSINDNTTLQDLNKIGF